MVKRLSQLFIFILLTSICVSCFEDQDDNFNPATTSEINGFVYRGLHSYYLYKDDIPVLQNNHFSSTTALNDYLSGFSSPEDLFESLLFNKDRFSVIFSDFYKLENLLNGISLNNGMAYGLVRISNSDQVFGYVRYVLPNTSASQEGVKRGMLFNRVDQTALTINNYQQLLAPQTYTIGLAELNENTLTNLNQNITLTKTQYTENPVLMHKTLTINGHKIGYLMYNAFTRAFDHDLNTAFADFHAEGITDLVIDLRYNGGGSIESSKDLASMITGQFEGELFATEVYNSNFPTQEINFDTKLHNGEAINSLQLNKVYIIATGSTASASELLINCLNPYINVVQIGTTTVGKFQGSITLYDSPDFRRSTVQPGHTYAMQPLILKTVNADGYTGYYNGLDPDISISEKFSNLGQLGNPNETLLQRAIQEITGTTTISSLSESLPVNFKVIGDNKAHQPNYQHMYTDFSD